MSDSGRWIENHKNGAISQNDKIKIFFFVMILWIITWDISNNGIINYRIKCIQEIKQWVIIRGFKYISIRDLTLVMGTLKWVVCKCHVMGLKK